MHNIKIKITGMMSCFFIVSAGFVLISWAQTPPEGKQGGRGSTKVSAHNAGEVNAGSDSDGILGPTDADIATWGKWLEDLSLLAREEAADKLARSGNLKAIPLLLKALKDSEPTVRQYPAVYLKNYEESTIRPALLAAFEKEDIWNVQNGLMRAIESKNVSTKDDSEYKKIRTQVFRRLKNKVASSKGIKEKAQATICLINNFNEKPDDYEGVLIDILDSSGNDYEKSASVKILGKLNTARSAAAIRRALKDKNKIVRDNAKKILDKADK